MKRIALAGGLALACIFSSFVYAANPTPTPIVPPNETGENSAGSQQVMDMARIKPGMGTLALTVSASAAAGTLNFASGAITLTSATAGPSGATPTVVTLTNNKAQAGDIALCWIDQTGATAGSVLHCNPHLVAGTLTLTLYDATPTALTASTVIMNYLILTTGNSN